MNQFYKDRTRGDCLGLKHVCKECDNTRKISWEKVNTPKIKSKNRRQQLRRYWPTSTGAEASKNYQQLFELQLGKCFICKRHQSEFNQLLSVDHNHITGEVRGLLCSDCNVGLGCFKDNPTLLNDAANYLRRNSSSLNLSKP